MIEIYVIVNPHGLEYVGAHFIPNGMWYSTLEAKCRFKES